VVNQIKALPRFKEMYKKLDSMALMHTSKKIVYTDSSDNLHAKAQYAMAHSSYKGLFQDKFRNIQEFHDQYVALLQVCTELD